MSAAPTHGRFEQWWVIDGKRSAAEVGYFWFGKSDEIRLDYTQLHRSREEIVKTIILAGGTAWTLDHVHHEVSILAGATCPLALWFGCKLGATQSRFVDEAIASGHLADRMLPGTADIPNDPAVHEISVVASPGRQMTIRLVVQPKYHYRKSIFTVRTPVLDYTTRGSVDTTNLGPWIP